VTHPSLESPSPRTRLGDAYRQLSHDIVGHQADDGLIDELAGVLTDFSRRLASGGPRSRDRSEFHEHWDLHIGEGDPVESFADRPVSGSSSPWGLEPDVRREGDGIIAWVTFHAAHEGAPDRCHGGIVAALFDDLLGAVLSVVGLGAFTGELTVRYDAPVPLHRELVCRCWLDRQEGRKLFMRGELTDAGRLVSSTSAVFIQPRDSPTQSTFDPA